MTKEREMAMSQDSQRVTETKEKIKEAFFDLYTQKKIEHISIKEITDRAKLNRGTFYVYYKDIYDLLEKVEDEIIVEITDKIKIIVATLLKEPDTFLILPPLEFYQKYHICLKILLGVNGDPNFIHKVKQLVKKNIKELIQKENILITSELDYVLEYVASAQIGIITYWMSRDMDLSLNELGDLIRQVSLQGPIGYFLRHKEG